MEDLVFHIISTAKSKGVSFKDFENYYKTEFDLIMNQGWVIGEKNRGLGRCSFCVMTNKNIVIVECPNLEVAEHICLVHNQSLSENKP